MIKKTILAGAVSLSLFGTTLLAVEAVAKGGNGGHGARISLLERLDSNDDGVLTIDEFIVSNADRAERGFNRKDVDDDGLLSLEEFSSTDGRRASPDLNELDKDALQLCMEDILGYELPDRPDSAAVFDEANTNGDEAVDLVEFQAAREWRATDRFAEIDGNADGELTSDEMDVYQALRQHRREAHRACVTEQLEMDALLN